MAPISSSSNLSIAVAQPIRTQAERSVPASETELAIKQEKQLQRADDTQSRQTSEQASSVRDTPSSPSVTQSDSATSEEKRQQVDPQTRGEQQKVEVAQQQAERADFNQQAGVSREEQSDNVRPSSNSESETPTNAPVVLQEKESPAIKIFNELQNINASSRQGQALNQFA